MSLNLNAEKRLQISKAIAMDLTLHPAAAQAIDDKGFGLLAAVDRLEFPAEPRKPAFQANHVVAAAITDGERHRRASCLVTERQRSAGARVHSS